MRARRQIGNTGVLVTDISFGASAIGNMARVVPEPEANEVLQSAWDAGIRYFDTAPHYGRGRSEERLGRFLKSRRREDYVLSTKVGRVLSPGTPLKEADGFSTRFRTLFATTIPVTALKRRWKAVSSGCRRAMSISSTSTTSAPTPMALQTKHICRTCWRPGSTGCKG